MVGDCLERAAQVLVALYRSEFLAEDTRISWVAERLGLHINTLRVYLKGLEKLGLVEVREGKAHLTPAGLEIAEVLAGRL